MKLKFYHFTAILSVLGIGVLVFFYFYGPNAPEDNITISTNISDWTNEKVTVTVESNLNKDEIKSYSFDNGNTWTDRNYISVNDNTVLKVIIKYTNNAKSKMISYGITNIDKIGPNITFTNNIEVKKDTEFDLLKNVIITDDGSGVDGDITVEPSTLDTSIVGNYEFKYSAKDKLGNVSEVTRIIKVVNELSSSNNSTSVQYRYRTKQKESYDCSETIYDTLTANPSYAYEGGYTCSGIEIDNYCLNPFSSMTPSNEQCESGYKYSSSSDMCYPILNTKQPYCSSEYTLNSSTNQCTKSVPKTVTKSCERDSWSEWSSWSNKAIAADENTEIETRNIGE